MRIPIQLSCIKCIAVVILSLSAGSAIAQSTISTIPQQVNQSAQTKAVTKTNTVTNGAMNSLDSASNKAFKGFTGLFKKKGNSKNKKNKTDSTGIHPTDTVAAPPKTSLRTNPGSSLCFGIPAQQQPADRSLAYDPRYIRRAAIKKSPQSIFSACS
jgi:hypothetical protein